MELQVPRNVIDIVQGLESAKAPTIVIFFSCIAIKLYIFFSKIWKSTLLDHILNAIGLTTVLAMKMQGMFSDEELDDTLDTQEEDIGMLIFCCFTVVTQCFAVIAFCNNVLGILLRRLWAPWSAAKRSLNSTDEKPSLYKVEDALRWALQETERKREEEQQEIDQLCASSVFDPDLRVAVVPDPILVSDILSYYEAKLDLPYHSTLKIVVNTSSNQNDSGHRSARENDSNRRSAREDDERINVPAAVGIA